MGGKDGGDCSTRYSNRHVNKYSLLNVKYVFYFTIY